MVKEWQNLFDLYDTWSLYDMTKYKVFQPVVSTGNTTSSHLNWTICFCPNQIDMFGGSSWGSCIFLRDSSMSISSTWHTWLERKSSHFSRTSYLYLVNGYLKATFCQHWFKHPATPIEIFSALDQETMVTRLIFNMGRVKKSCCFQKEGVLLYRYMNMHIRSYIHTCIKYINTLL